MRSDFSRATIELLAKRVGYRCSRPSCRRSTVAAHSDSNKATFVGEAAHICAAAPGGPRYDVSMTEEERSGLANGIWLCPGCATEIDKDPQRFPVSLLRDWKTSAEREAQTELQNPARRWLQLPRPAFEPPLAYQLSAVKQVFAHLRSSGVPKATLPPLAYALGNLTLRDGINPIFEPLSLEAVGTALSQLIEAGDLVFDGTAFVL